MGSKKSKFNESRREVKVIDPTQDVEKLGASENSKSDESRRKLNVVDPPQDAEKLGVSVRELLECPVCMDIMYPPIYQCSDGHALCSNCKPRMNDLCPTCRQNLGNIRCLILEKVAESLDLPCKYQKFGCSDVFPYRNNLKHESQCHFRPYSCPSSSPTCPILGDISFLVSHLKECHEGLMRSGSTIIEQFQRFKNNNPHEGMNVWWYPLEEAKNYGYSLEFGDNERKMVWQGVPRSIRESHRKARDSLDGLIIQDSLFFGGDNEKELMLKVTVKIWKGE